MQYPPSYTLVHNSQCICKESQGYYCLLEREMSGWKRFLRRKGLLQAAAANTALYAQSSQQNRTPCSNLVFPTQRSETFSCAWISGVSEDLKRGLRKSSCSKPMDLQSVPNHQFSWYGKGSKNAVCQLRTPKIPLQNLCVSRKIFKPSCITNQSTKKQIPPNRRDEQSASFDT